MQTGHTPRFLAVLAGDPKDVAAAAWCCRENGSTVIVRTVIGTDEAERATSAKNNVVAIYAFQNTDMTIFQKTYELPIDNPINKLDPYVVRAMFAGIACEHLTYVETVVMPQPPSNDVLDRAETILQFMARRDSVGIILAPEDVELPEGICILD